MKSQKILDISECLFLAAVALGGAMTLRLAIQRLGTPYQLNYEEGNILNAAVRIIQGANPYPPVQPPVYIFNPYGPVAYYLMAPLVKYFGPVFLYPRMAICVAGLAIAALIVFLLLRAGVGWRVSLSFGLLYLTMPVVQAWVYLLRVDLIGIVLTLAGLGICWILPRRWYLAAPLFLAAIYCKYTLIASPAACCLDFLLRKEWRKAAGLAACIGGLSLGLFFLLQRATQGWFAFNMLRTHTDPYFISLWADFMLPALRVHAILVGLAIVLAVKYARTGNPSLPVIYFGLASLMTLTAGKFGSDTNHLLEWLASLCLAAGLGYHALRQRKQAQWALALVPVALSMVVLVTLRSAPNILPERDGCSEAYAYVKDHSGNHFLSNNVGAIVLAEKTVTFSNLFVYSFLVKSSVLSDEELTGEVRARYYDAILLGVPLDELKDQADDPDSPYTFLNAGFVEALERNYHVVREFRCRDARAAYEPNG